MAPEEEKEEQLLRSAALQTSTSILLARNRAEQELIAAKEALERKTQELAASLALMRATFESTTDGILVTDRDGQVSDFNEKYVEMWRIPRALLEGREGGPVLEACSQQLKNSRHFLTRVKSLCGLGPTESFDVLEFKDGRVFERFSKIQCVDHCPVGRVWSFRDITKRKEAEDALGQSQARLQMAMEAGQMGHWEWTLATGQVLWSTSLEAIHGLKPGGFGGRFEDFQQDMHPEDRERILGKIRDCVEHRTDYQIEYRILRPDGKMVWIEARGKLFVNEAREPERLVGICMDITPRKRAEEAMRQSAALLRATFDQAAVGIGIAALNGQLIQVNQRFAEIIGYTREELALRTFQSLTHPEEADQTLEVLRGLLAGNIPYYTMEKRYIRKDGTPIWSHVTATLLKDASGEASQLIGVIEDISHRKTAEEALRQSEKRFRELADAMPQIVWTARPDGFLDYYNRRWYELTGALDDQVGDQSWKPILHPEDVQSCSTVWYQAVRSGTPYQNEYRFRNQSGQYRWHLGRALPVRNEAGDIVKWFGSSTDIEDQKRAEEALRDESRILELLNQTGTAIAAQLDLQNLVQTVTDAATQLSGAQFGAFFYHVLNEQGESVLLYSLSGAPREAFANIGLPRNTPMFNATFKGEGVVRSGDITRDPRYGTLLPHHGMPKGHLPVRSYLAVPVISRSGQVIGGLFFGHSQPHLFTERTERMIVGVAAQAAIAIDNARLYEAAQREIAERSRAEQALLEAQQKLSKHTEVLEQEVAQRTAHLNQSIQSLEGVCYTIAHDLRAPLRTVQGFTKIILEDYASSFDPDGQRLAARIIFAATRMDHLIRDLLEYAKLNHVPLPCADLDLNEILQKAQDNLGQEISAKAATLSLQSLPRIWGNQTIVEQVFTNLLGNALKFVAPGVNPHIQVWAKPAPPGGVVRVLVQDNGIGIEGDQHERVFGIFQRLHNDEKKYSGTGVGLAIVKKGLERIGARVEIDATVTRGTRFQVEFLSTKGTT